MTTLRRIPLNASALGPAEETAVLEALRAGSLAPGGRWERLLSAELSRRLEAAHVFPVSSCTAALEAAFLALDLGPGDEVLVPSHAFVGCATAVERAGAAPVFVDVRGQDGNLDPKQIERAATSRVKAVLAVHYGGFPCDMPAIAAAAARLGIPVVEDAAHALGSRPGGAPPGALSAAACFSFHATKDLTCGQGGAVATRHAWLARRLETVCERGTNRRAFLAGKIDRYEWVGAGGNFGLSDLLAALALAQLERLEDLLAPRRRNADLLRKLLREACPVVGLPEEGPAGRANYHLFPVRVPPARRSDLIAALAEDGIEASAHFPPLHESPRAKARGYRALPCPNARAFSDSVLRLPIHAGLEEDDLRRIAAIVGGALSGA